MEGISPQPVWFDLLAFILLSYTEYVSVHLLGSPGHFDQQISVLMDNEGGMIPPGGSALCCEHWEVLLASGSGSGDGAQHHCV